jgi:hypothetical protein
MSTSTSHIRYTEDLVRFPTLASDGRNWTTWKKQFYLSTVARGLKRHLEESTEAPKATNPAYETWEVEEAGLKEKMALTICDIVYEKISDFETVHEAYNELVALFGTRSRIFVGDTPLPHQPFEMIRTRPYHYRAYNLNAMIVRPRPTILKSNQ